jgi:cysteine desulfuration protein SufE
MIFQQGALDDRLIFPPLEAIEQAQRRIVDEFAFVGDWSDRYQTLIDVGRRLAPMPDRLKVDHNRIRNCQGEAWLAAEWQSGRMYLSAASDTGVVAGILAILVEVYSGHTPDDISGQPLTVLDAVGLTDHLSPHRRAAYREIISRLEKLARQMEDRGQQARGVPRAMPASDPHARKSHPTNG